MGLLVKNLRGTSGSRYKIGRLSHRFAAHTGSNVAKCQAAGCCEPAGATAHVIAADGSRTWLLCRVCKGHNSPRRTAPYRLRDGAVTVPVTALRAALKSKAATRKRRAAKAKGGTKRGGVEGPERARSKAAKAKRPRSAPGAPAWAWVVGVVAFGCVLAG